MNTKHACKHLFLTHHIVLIIACTLAAGPALFAAGAKPLTDQERAQADQFNSLTRRAVQQVLPAVVSIHVSKQVGPNPFIPQGGEVPGVGSGCIIDPKGYVITNNHVVEDTDKIIIVLADGRHFDAQEKMLDPDTDLAIVRFDPKGEDLPVAVFGDSAQVQVGDYVMAIGSPFGFMLSQTVTSGIVSFKGRQTGILDRQWGYEDFIQTDADISKGNSGGPLVNLYGEIIGINSNILSPDTSGVSSGYGFSIPSNLAKFVTRQLIESKTVRRGWLGITMQSVSYIHSLSDEDRQKLLKDFPEILDNIPDDQEGVLVMSVTEGDPADKGGMKVKDVILKINHIATTDSNILRNYIATLPPETEITCQIRRDREPMTLTITLGDRAQAKAKNTTPSEPRIVLETPRRYSPDEKPKLGIGVSELDNKTLEKFSYPAGTEGVLITHVIPGSVADRNGLKEGDVIVRIEGTPVIDKLQLKSIVTDADLSKGIEVEIYNSQGLQKRTIKAQPD